jgi:hypothetical protein
LAAFRCKVTWVGCYSVVMTTFALWLANRAMGPLWQPYDAGLYHLNAIRWQTEYPSVPGLGNLHTRLATVPSYFLYMGLLDVLPGRCRPWNLAHGLLLLFAMAQIVWTAFRILLFLVQSRTATSQGVRAPGPGEQVRPGWHDMVALLFMPVILRLCFLEASSTNYDLPVFLLGFVVCLQTARALDGRSPVDWKGIGMIVCAAGAVAVTMRVGIGGLVITGAALLWVWRHRRGEEDITTVLLWLVLPVLLAVGCVARNIVHSGYVLPVPPVLGLPVDWRIPAEHLDFYKRVIMGWARDYRLPPEQVLANWAWVWPWFKGVIGFFWLEMTIPLLLTTLAVLLTPTGACWRGRRLRIEYLSFLLPPTVMLVSWFVSVPDQRFASAAFWWLASAAVLLACEAWGGAQRRLCWITTLVAACGLAAWFCFPLTKYTRPGPLPGGHYPVPNPCVTTFVSESGLKILVPAKGDQLWDSPLPASPYPNPHLRLRRTGDLSSGFSVSLPSR